MRDKLIKLLDYILGSSKFRFDAWENTDKIADFLLKNDIIVLPCKLDTKIYHIDLEIPENEVECSACSKNCSGFGEFWCDDDYLGWPSMEDKLIQPKDVCPKYKPCIKEEKFTLHFWANLEKWFNKTWFLTEEEAKKALEEFNNEASI